MGLINKLWVYWVIFIIWVIIFECCIYWIKDLDLFYVVNYVVRFYIFFLYDLCFVCKIIEIVEVYDYRYINKKVKVLILKGFIKIIV